MLLGMAEQIQVPYMEEVECSCCVSDPHCDLPVRRAGVAEVPVIPESYPAKRKKGVNRTL
ncbi:hypothetical protein GCM10023160_07880 [Brachybacterium paraconglomeratum]